MSKNVLSAVAAFVIIAAITCGPMVIAFLDKRDRR